MAINNKMKKQIKKLAKKAKKEKKQIDKFKKLAINFLGSTLAIFDQDWEHTKYCLQFNSQEGHNDYWAKGGTFLEPNIPDSPENWSSRLGFLADFRKFRAFVNSDKFYKKAFAKKHFNESYCYI